MKINNVLFTENSLFNMCKIIDDHKLKTEIGGSLVGYRQDGQLIITHASDPGVSARMSFDSIEIDGEYVTKFCNRLNELSNNKLYFLGDWHTHLSNNLKPSKRDLIAMKVLCDYVPPQYKESLITIIVNHYNPSKFKVYSLNNGSKLKNVSHSMIPNPPWIIKYI